MENEKCANCQKPQAEHVLELGALFCYEDKRRQEKWIEPAPQAVLFEASKVRTGYEL